jgi:hypothetical protein
MLVAAVAAVRNPCAVIAGVKAFMAVSHQPEKATSVSLRAREPSPIYYSAETSQATTH